MKEFQFRFATYNIQYGYGQDGKYDLNRVIGAVADADILCLQEVCTNWRACDMDLQPDLLAAGLNRYAAFSPGYELDSSYTDASGQVVNCRRGFGNMVLSRWPIIYSRSHALPRPLLERAGDTQKDLPRCVLETVVELPGQALRIMSVHLSHQSSAQRLAQIAALRKLIAELPEQALLWRDLKSEQDFWAEGKVAPPVEMETVLAGDFNFEPHHPEYAAITAPFNDNGLETGASSQVRNNHFLLDAWQAQDTRATRPTTCVETDGSQTALDYVFVTQNLAASIRHVLVRKEALGSDHFPVIAEMKL